MPAGVVVVESRVDTPVAPLPPAEDDAVANAVEHRRLEFGTTRWCARQALARLGFSEAVIPKGSAGEPLWPAGVVGSLTHCVGFRAAAVSTELRAIGLDAEPHEPLPREAVPLVVLDSEHEAHSGSHMPLHWERIVFSAKESIYKAWYPLTHRWLDFSDAQVTLHPDGSFSTVITKPSPLRMPFEGRWTISGGLILTTATLL